jgi:uncharacterized protein YbaP (TraB family)
MPHRVRRAFEQSDTLAVEIDIMALSPGELLIAQSDHMLAPEGQTLADLIPESTMRDLEAYAERTGFPLQTVMPMRPWVAAQTLAQGGASDSGFTPAEAVDMIYMTRRGSREVIGLETLEEQLSVFADLPLEMEVQMLQEVLAAPSGADEDVPLVLVIADAWRLGDERALASIVHVLLGDPTVDPDDDADQGPDLFDAFLTRRNEKMATQLARFARDPARAGQSLFTVVGAAHLVGERSIRDFLTESGLRIEQLGPVRRPRTAAAAPAHPSHASEEVHAP